MTSSIGGGGPPRTTGAADASSSAPEGADVGGATGATGGVDDGTDATDDVDDGVAAIATDDVDDGVPAERDVEVPASLRLWFVVHAVVDVVAAVPLLLVPEEILPRLGWPVVDPVSARLVGAALVAIGVQSWRTRNAGVAVYRAMLALKVIWSACAIFGLGLAIARGAPPLAYLFLSIFLAFCGVWSHHAIRFRQRFSSTGGSNQSVP